MYRLTKPKLQDNAREGFNGPDLYDLISRCASGVYSIETDDSLVFMP
jgi:hypothetical protein